MAESFPGGSVERSCLQKRKEELARQCRRYRFERPRATDTEPVLQRGNHNYWTHVPQILKLTCPMAMLCSKRVKSLSCVRLFVTPWTVTHQASLSMGFSRQESWSGLPFLSPGDLPDPGIEPGSPVLQADTLTSEPPGKPPQMRNLCTISRE